MREKRYFQIALFLPIIAFVIITKLFDIPSPLKTALLAGLVLSQTIVFYRGRRFVDRARIIILIGFIIASVGIMFWQLNAG